MCLISIIIPSYNSENYILNAVDSVLIQTYKKFEIIVVDDGSKDKTGEILRSRYSNKVIYLRQENKGPSSARNTGLRLAKGVYVSFLDADDTFLPNKLEVQVNYLNTHPDIDLVYSDGLRFRKTKSGEVQRRMVETGDVAPLYLSPDAYVYELIQRNLFPIHAALVRTKCVQDCGGFDPTLSACEDWDLWFRLSEKYRFAYVDRIVTKYQVTPGSNSTDFYRNYKEMIRVMERISTSPFFDKASEIVQSNFYYRLGITWLFVDNPSNAKKCFQQALFYQPRSNPPRTALLLLNIFNNKAIEFYKMKRYLFGINGNKKI